MPNQLLHLHLSLPQDGLEQVPLQHLCHLLNHIAHGISMMVACVLGAMLVTTKTNVFLKMFVTTISVLKTSPTSSVTQTLMGLPVTGRRTHAKVRDKNQSDVLLLAISVFC